MPTIEAYDQRPYDSKPASLVHPDRMFTLARLYNLDPKPITNARMLELGCAEGGNVIPLAANLPESEFIAVDLSQRQVQHARNTANALHLTNIDLRHANIMDVDESYGRFDYILCHGIYSWVPEPVREQILHICGTMLNPGGVAYVDYNTYPGWLTPEALRRFMLDRTKDLTDPDQRIDAALEALRFLKKNIQADDEQKAHVQKEIDRILKIGTGPVRNTLFYHEYLEDENQPFWFGDFMKRAQNHGLQFLGEAVFSEMSTHGLADPNIEKIGLAPQNIIETEQAMDHLRRRRFRRTLLVRADEQPDRNIRPETLLDLKATVTSGVTPELIAKSNTQAPVQNLMLKLMETRPQAHPIRDQLDPTTDAQAVAPDLIQMYAENMLLLMSTQAPFTTNPGPNPTLNPLALHQARNNQPWLTNQCHEPSTLPTPILDLAKQLDGTKNRVDLLIWLQTEIQQNRMTISSQNQPVTNPTKNQLTSTLNHMLQHLARHALLTH